MAETTTPQKIIHFLVPEHVKLSEEEKQEVLNKHNINSNQLPQIHFRDSAIQSFNPKIGDVIKITRQSPTARQTVFYRVVVDG